MFGSCFCSGVVCENIEVKIERSRKRRDGETHQNHWSLRRFQETEAATSRIKQSGDGERDVGKRGGELEDRLHCTCVRARCKRTSKNLCAHSYY